MHQDNKSKGIFIYTEKDCQDMRSFFKSYVSGLVGISHFSITLITKEKKSFLLSSSKDFTTKFKEKQYHQYDNTLNPIMYENLHFYTWAKGYSQIKQNEIKAIKREYDLNNGTVFVRELQDGNKLLYCIATQKKDPIMKTIFVNHANSILLSGDNAYNDMRWFFEEASGINLPKINSFSPFLQTEIQNFSAYEDEQKNKILSIIRKKYITLVIDNTKKDNP